ncbi:HAD-IIIA family hydrolase [Candidatus Pelagibacter sp. HIMB1506]|uniref:HAD-IIIA family hydrolase n=1 Tax=Candidatus Pelagibacter sp. HIMB1506 TaxID=3413337 RepID=UPI003F853A53
MPNIKQGVILCGGLGTRLGSLTLDKPKAMIEVAGKPFLEHLILQLKKNGISKILLLVGYKNNIIQNYFADGKKFDVKIKYSYLPENFDTGSRIYKAKRFLHSKFLLLYCDNYSSLNVKKLDIALNEPKKKIIFSLVRKKNGNCKISQNGNIFYKKKRNTKYPFVEIGYMAIKKEALDKLTIEDFNFSSFLEKISKKKISLGYIELNSYLSIGDRKRLLNTKKTFLNNKYILVDRDGVLNFKSRNHRYIINKKNLKINIKFCKKFPEKSKLICITNQAGIATKDIKMKDLMQINYEIIKYLKKKKIKLTRFYISTDHFNSKSIKRKPNPGLFFKSAKDNNFILDKTFYIGDDKRDIEAAYNANTHAIYIGKEKFTAREKKKYEFILLKNSIKKLYNEKQEFKF